MESGVFRDVKFTNEDGKSIQLDSYQFILFSFEFDLNERCWLMGCWAFRDILVFKYQNGRVMSLTTYIVTWFFVWADFTVLTWAVIYWFQ